MEYLRTATSGVDNMINLFKRRKKPDNDDLVEKEVNKIKEAYFKDIDKKTKVIKKANIALKRYNKSNDLTLNIFLATGGDKRK